MYIYNIVVKWPNGDLEGFGSSGLDRDTAKERAVRKASEKQSLFRIVGIFQVLNSKEYQELTIDEQDSIQNDWDGQSL